MKELLTKKKKKKGLYFKLYKHAGRRLCRQLKRFPPQFAVLFTFFTPWFFFCVVVFNRKGRTAPKIDHNSKKVFCQLTIGNAIVGRNQQNTFIAAHDIVCDCQRLADCQFGDLSGVLIRIRGDSIQVSASISRKKTAPAQSRTQAHVPQAGSTDAIAAVFVF